MSPDKTICMGSSVIQHGPLNNRAYLMSLAPADYPDIVYELEQLAKANKYTKVFVKVPESLSYAFTKAGYITEARVPGYFKGREDALFMGLFLAQSRAKPDNADLLNKVMETAGNKTNSRPGSLQKFEVLRMKTAHAGKMAEVYSRVFDSYPFPIYDPDYLIRTMQNNVHYFGIKHGEHLAALASAATDMKSLTAEMTDFATLPQYCKMGMAGTLLDRMAREAQKMGILTMYSIARATSFGINITFARAGWDFAGMLINNTHIAGKIESMNVWSQNTARMAII